MSFTKNQGGNLNDPAIQAASEAKPLFDAEQFVRESPVWRQMQYDAIKANLGQAANDQGFEIVSIKQINSSVVRLAAYIGDQRTSLRCRSMVCGLLRSAGVSIRKDKLFIRYRQSVIRCVFVPNWD